MSVWMVRYTENYTSLSLKDNKGQCLEKEGDCHFEDYRLGRNDIKNLVYHILSEIYRNDIAMGNIDGYSANEAAHGDV